MANVVTNLNDMPKPGQNLQVTRDPINANFAAIDTAFSVNHVSYDLTGGAAQGKHKFVTMPVQGSQPAVVGADVVLFNKADSGTISQLYIKGANSNAGNIIPFTQSASNSAPKGGTGYCWFASGILMKWSAFTTGSGSSVTINVNTNFGSAPQQTTIFSAQVTPTSNNRVYISNIAYPSITIKSSSANGTFIIWTIGNGTGV